MKETKKSGVLRAVTAICTAAAALCVGSLAAATASADTTAPVFGNITDTKGSIIIHKHEHQNGTAVTADPKGPDTITSPGVGDVTFTVYKLDGLNLLQENSWTGLSDVTIPANPTAGTQITVNGTQYPLVKVTDVTTAGDGMATAADLPVAAYVVVETSHPSTVVDSASPFLVTIPYPDNQGSNASNGWLYNVNVYPKNGVQTVTKSVSQQTSLGLGSKVSFPVTSKVQTLAENTSFEYYWVQDVLDSRLGEVGVSSVSLNGAALTEGTDYTVSVNGQYVVAQFTQAGLSKLAANQGKDVVTTFTGKVTGLGTGAASGAIDNTAYVATGTVPGTTPPVTPPTPPTEPPTTPPGTPSNEVTTNWGDLKIQKLDAGNSSGLSGAKFEVYEAETAYPAGDADGTKCTTTLKDPTKPISVAGQSTFTTDENGHVTISGLFVSDSENVPKDNGFRCYVLKEVQAPAGYVTPTGSDALTAVAVKTGQTDAASYDATVKNTKQAIPGLPLTGSQAMIVVVAAGVLLVGGSISLVIANRRRRA